MIDGEGHLKHMFWFDTQSRLDYEAFGDVVVFIVLTGPTDTTCHLCLLWG